MFIHTQNYTLNKTVFPARSKTQQKVYSFPTGSTKAKDAAVTVNSSSAVFLPRTTPLQRETASGACCEMFSCVLLQDWFDFIYYSKCLSYLKKKKEAKILLRVQSMIAK